MANQEGNKARLAAVVRDYLSARDSGSPPSREKILADNPDIAQGLHEFFVEQDRTILSDGKEGETKPKVADPLAATIVGDVQKPENNAPIASEFDSQADTILPSSTPDRRVKAAAGGLLVKKKIGDYELLDQIGHGGMGVVYRARQVSLDRIVALKMIRSGELASRREVERFQIEAESAAELDHPAIVPIFEVGESGGTHYFSMGFVAGQSLGGKLKDGPLSPQAAAEMTLTLARAVAYAHERGVIHRDLKPDNVLLDSNEQPRITDFGLAKRIDSDSQQTRTGEILGTPAFMPPEQAAGKTYQIGAPADIYGLGAVLYAMLTVRPPFQAATQMDTLRQVLEREPVGPRQMDSGIPHDLETICLKCLQKEPAKRYLSSNELANDLERFIQGKPILARPVGWVEKSWMWCKRNPWTAVPTAAAALLAVVLMIGGPILAASFYQQKNLAEKERQNSQANEKKAIENAGSAIDNSRLVVDKIYNVYRKSTKRGSNDKTADENRELMKELLQLALDGAAEMSEKHDSFVRADVGMSSAYKKFGEIYLAMEQTEKALGYLHKSLKMAEQLNADGSLKDPHFNLAKIRERLGQANRNAGKYDEARRHFLAVRKHWEARRLEKPEKEFGHSMVIAQCNIDLGLVAMKQGIPAVAKEHYAKALKQRQDWVAAEPENSNALFRLADVYGAMANVAFSDDDFPNLHAYTKQKIGVLENLRGLDPDNVMIVGDLGTTYYSWAGFTVMEGKPQEAVKLYDESIQRLKRVIEAGKLKNYHKNFLGRAYYDLGATYQMLESGEALGFLQKSRALRKELLDLDPNSARKQTDWMLTLARCGEHIKAAKIASDLQQNSPDQRQLKEIAGCYAWCSATTNDDDEKLKQHYLDSAIAAFTEAVDKGYGDVVMLRRDPDLAPIRDTPKFVDLVAKLEDTQKTKP